MILNVSHFCGYYGKDGEGKPKDFDHGRFIAMFRAKLGPYMRDPSSREGMPANKEPSELKRTIGELTAAGPRVFVIYRDDAINGIPRGEGFFRDYSLYDDYSDTDKLGTMVEDQAKKLKDNSGTEARPFLLSWTLTYQPSDFPVYSTLHELTKEANRGLGAFVKTYKDLYKMNILYVDFFADSRATDIAIAANR